MAFHDLRAFLERLDAAGRSKHPLLGNFFGHRDRIEAALAGRPLSSLRELGELLATVKEPRWPGSLRAALAAWPEFAQFAHVAPRRVADAAFRDEVLSGDDVDLTRLPIQRCWPEDAGPLTPWPWWSRAARDASARTSGSTASRYSAETG